MHNFAVLARFGTLDSTLKVHAYSFLNVKSQKQVYADKKNLFTFIY